MNPLDPRATPDRNCRGESSATGVADQRRRRGTRSNQAHGPRAMAPSDHLRALFALAAWGLVVVAAPLSLSLLILAVIAIW